MISKLLLRYNTMVKYLGMRGIQRLGILVMEDFLQEGYDASLIKAADALVIGCGFAGAVAARQLAESMGLRVVVVERRPHIAGNAFDHLDDKGVLIHEYGPHIFHSVSKRVYDYLSGFTEWRSYEHKVLAFLRGIFVPVPFNLNSIELCFEESKAKAMREMLLSSYGRGAKVGIIELRKHPDPLLQELADFVYENVFLHYTMKQWGVTPEEIDPAVTGRVPVLVDEDDRYFQDPYQGMPLDGYTALFERLLDHPDITVYTNLDARDILTFEEGVEQDAGFTAAKVCNEPYEGLIIYTGALDELCDERFGLLPYRSLDFVYRHYDQRFVQPCGTVNFTVSEDFTRTSEYTWLTGQDIDSSTIAEEYPRAYTDPLGQIPYYPIISDENLAHYERYLKLFKGLRNFHVLGRLAEYRYYNMDQIALRALELVDEIRYEQPAD